MLDFEFMITYEEHVFFLNQGGKLEPNGDANDKLATDNEYKTSITSKEVC